MLILRYDLNENGWTLQSGFDGAELFARPGIEFVTVTAQAIREAERQITGCDACRGKHAHVPFDWILADVLDKHGMF
jgi:hypothetical protein